MAITGTTLASEVLGKLELNQSSTSLLAKFQIYQNLSNAQLHIMNILPIQFLSEGIKTVTFNLEQDESEYQWPTSTFPFLRYVALWVDFANPIVMGGVAAAAINPGRRVIEYDADLHNLTPDALGTANYPFIDLNVEVGFMIYPVPGAAVTNGGRLRYIYKPADISATQDSLLNPGLRNLLVYKAVQLSALIDQYRPDLADRFDRLFDKELAGYLPKDEIKQ